MKRIERLANSILLGTGGFLALILAFQVFAHGVAPHYIFFAVVAMCFFASPWLSGSVKINLAFVVLSLLISVYTGELVLSFVASSRADFAANQWLTFPSDFSQESTRARLEKNQKEKPTFDRRGKLQVIEDFARQGLTAFPAVFPQALLTSETAQPRKAARALSIDGVETLPLGGISNVLTVFCNESGEYVLYTSDEHGFRNPPGIWDAPRLDIVAVGDSFTQGSCVPSEENFVGVIRAQYPSTVSLGMDSNGPVTMLASLKEYAQPYRPKIVLWFYYEGNDLKDMDWEQTNPLLMRYVTGPFSQRLINRQAEIDRALIDYIDNALRARGERSGWEHTIKLHQLRQSLATWYSGNRDDDAGRIRSTMTYFSSEVTDEEINLFRSVLVEAASTVRGWGGQLYVVYLPEWARYAKPEFANKNRERILRLVNTLKLPVIDLHPLFARIQDPVGLFPFRQLNHYNSDGHRLVGEESFEYCLKRNRYLVKARLKMTDILRAAVDMASP